MGILFEFLGDMRRWDTATKIAMCLAFGLLWVMIAVLMFGGERWRNPSLAGAIGMLGSMQAIALWGNRHLVSVYTQAQRAFMNGDFAQTRALLEKLISDNQNAQKNTDIDVYVLLGNATRNLGDLQTSLRVLQHAVQSQPDYHFALYGLGRTQIVLGAYAEAITSIKKSILQGAPNVVKFDLGFAYFLANDHEMAQETLLDILPSLNEVHRQAMAQWILFRLGIGEEPTQETLREALLFWQAEVKRFLASGYAQAVQQMIGLWIQ
jgi:tetratricopeptide (TPR) repeat protein